MSIEILDPTHEAEGSGFALATRLDSVQGKTIGILSNGKKGTKTFFDALANELTENYGANVIRRTKFNFSAPAEAAIMQEAAQWDALIAGIGD